MNPVISSRFDYKRYPTSAKELQRVISNDYATIELDDPLKYMEVKINDSFYDIMFIFDRENLPKKEKSNNEGSVITLSSSSKKEKKDLTPYFLIIDKSDPLKIQIPFEDTRELIEYLTLVESGQIPVI